MALIIPSYASRYARSQGEAEHPELWQGLQFAWDAGLGNTGAVARDVSGNGRHCSVNGATWGAGKFGGCLNFNGTSDYLLGTDNIPFSSSGVTMAAWLSMTANQFCASVIVKGDTNNTGLQDWGIMLVSLGSGLYAIRNGGNVTGISAIPANQLIHLLVACNSSVSVVCVNGQVIDTQGGIGSGVTANTAGRYLNIMRAGSSYIGGQLASVGVWDGYFPQFAKVLTQDPHALTRLRRIRYRPVAATTTPPEVVEETIHITDPYVDEDLVGSPVGVTGGTAPYTFEIVSMTKR